MNLAALAIAALALVLSVLQRRARSTLPVATFVRDTFPWSSSLVLPLLGATAAGAVVVLAPAWFLAQAGWLAWSRAQPLSAPVVAPALATVVVKIVLAAAEELAFRGAIIEQVARRTSLAAGIFASTLLFAAAHVGRPEAGGPFAATVFVLDGLGFSFAYLATGSLWVPTCWHAAKDVTIWLLNGHGALEFTRGLWRAQGLRESAWVGGAHVTGGVDVVATFIVVATAVRIATKSARSRASRCSAGDASRSVTSARRSQDS